MSKLTLEEKREKQAIKDAVNEEARANFRNEQWRGEWAQLLTETIYEGFQHENLLSTMATVETVPWDGRVTVSEVRGLRAYWIARGGYIEASTLHKETVEVQKDMIGFHVEFSEDKIRANFAETQSTLIDLGIQRLDAQINQRALAMFQAAIPSSSPYYSAMSGLSLTAINAAIRAVKDASRSQQLAIVGRYTMTEQILELLTDNSSNPGFIPETNEAILRTGQLGRYRGIPLVSLVNFLDDDDEPFFPANELYIIGTDASKFGLWGELEHKEFIEQDNWYWHYLARREFGGLIHRPDRIRRLVDSTITA